MTVASTASKLLGPPPTASLWHAPAPAESPNAKHRGGDVGRVTAVTIVAAAMVAAAPVPGESPAAVFGVPTEADATMVADDCPADLRRLEDTRDAVRNVTAALAASAVTSAVALKSEEEARLVAVAVDAIGDAAVTIASNALVDARVALTSSTPLGFERLGTPPSEGDGGV